MAMWSDEEDGAPEEGYHVLVPRVEGVSVQGTACQTESAVKDAVEGIRRRVVKFGDVQTSPRSSDRTMRGSRQHYRAKAAYRELGDLHRGAHWCIRSCVRRIDGQECALKCIPFDGFQSSDVEMLTFEIEALERMCEHPHVVGYFGSFVEDDEVVLVMEHAQMGDLDTLIRTQRKQKQFFPEERVLRWAGQIVSAVAACHDAGILHRDLKATNILLNEEGNALLNDFSRACRLEGEHTTRTGTAYYMSPEMCLGHAYGAPSDAWALGVLLYRLSMLTYPFKDNTLKKLLTSILKEPPRRLTRHFSREWNDLVMSLLDRDPTTRATVHSLLHHDLLAPYTVSMDLPEPDRLTRPVATTELRLATVSGELRPNEGGDKLGVSDSRVPVPLAASGTFERHGGNAVLKSASPYASDSVMIGMIVTEKVSQLTLRDESYRGQGVGSAYLSSDNIFGTAPLPVPLPLPASGAGSGAGAGSGTGSGSGSGAGSGEGHQGHKGRKGHKGSKGNKERKRGKDKDKDKDKKKRKEKKKDKDRGKRKHKSKAKGGVLDKRKLGGHHQNMLFHQSPEMRRQHLEGVRELREEYATRAATHAGDGNNSCEGVSSRGGEESSTLPSE